jgi:hypothetical protein
LNKLYNVELKSEDPILNNYLKNNNTYFENMKIFNSVDNSNILIENILLNKNENSEISVLKKTDYDFCLLLKDNKCIQYPSFNEYCETKQLSLYTLYNIKDKINNTILDSKRIESHFSTNKCIDDKYLNQKYYFNNMEKRYNKDNQYIIINNNNINYIEQQRNNLIINLKNKNYNKNDYQRMYQNNHYENSEIQYDLYNHIYQNSINNDYFELYHNILVENNFNQFKFEILPNLIIKNIELIEDVNEKFSSEDSKLFESIIKRIDKNENIDLNQDFEYLISKYNKNGVLKFDYGIYLLSKNEMLKAKILLEEAYKMEPLNEKFIEGFSLVNDVMIKKDILKSQY